MENIIAGVKNSERKYFWRDEMTYFCELQNSHSQNKSKQDSVAPSRRRKSGAVVQTIAHAFSGKSQFQQPEGHSVV